MQYNTHLFIVSLAVLFCLCDTTNAFTTNLVSPIVDVPQRQKQQLQRVRTATTLSHHSSIYQTIVSEEGRRDFLKQLSTAITGASLSPLLLPQLAYADDNEDDATTIDKVETILKDESELDTKVIQEEEDEKKSIEDEKQLINELEKEISIEESETSTPEEIEKEASKVRGETEALIEEEEKLLNEAEEIISKIESIESEVQSLDEVDKSNNGAGGDATTSTETTSEEFVEKLKERVERKEDLITRLKRQSENDIDPKTGKFRPLTPEEYKDRVKNTDVDFLQFLKDTVANEKEWEQDLNAFEGFLDKEFGPAVRELKKDLTPLVREAKKDLKPLVDEAETELRQEVAPAVEDALKRLKEKAGKAADDEAEDLKQRAGDLIGKLKGIF